MEEKNNKSSLVMAEIMPPEKENFGGHIHGGYILDQVQAAYNFQRRITNDDLSFMWIIFLEDLPKEVL